jgi:hypothetical protein
MNNIFAASFALIFQMVGMAPASVVSVQTQTQKVCECRCTRLQDCSYSADFIPVSAACPDGTLLTGGGYRWKPEPDLARVADSFPRSQVLGTAAWTVIAKAPHENPCNQRDCSDLTVYAICASPPAGDGSRP